MNRIDLLTVVMHELGHILGFDHKETGVMAETLAAGSRPIQSSDLSSYDLVFADLARLLGNEVQHRHSSLVVSGEWASTSPAERSPNLRR